MSLPAGRGKSGCSWSNNCSISSSCLSESLKPSAPKNLIPLSATGLWEAEIITPNCAPISRVKYATPGVEITPNLITSAPIDANPAIKADSNISPDTRVSLPTKTLGCFSPSLCANT